MHILPPIRQQSAPSEPLCRARRASRDGTSKNPTISREKTPHFPLCEKCGLGVNQGARLEQLERAFHGLHETPGITVRRTSSIYETEAVLPEGAPSDWDMPYLNAAALVDTTLSPLDLLTATQTLERELGRRPARHWAPRLMDIDIIAHGDATLTTERLTLPHPRALERAFVLTPCAEIDPTRVLPNTTDTLLSAKRKAEPLPAWMQIVNVTPDSFSGDGRLVPHLGDVLANYLDIGAESTRPGATELNAEEEWARLAPVLEPINPTRFTTPKISIDTRHAETARRALATGAVDMVNDVTGIKADMAAVLADAPCDVVVMHSLTVPANPKRVLPKDADPVNTIRDWFLERIETLERQGINPARMILDPGIGFGKTAGQSLELIRRAEEFLGLGYRVMYGHSRKSYLGAMTKLPAAERDTETLAVSARLAERGVDVLRVHDAETHRRFWRVYARA